MTWRRFWTLNLALLAWLSVLFWLLDGRIESQSASRMAETGLPLPQDWFLGVEP